MADIDTDTKDDVTDDTVTDDVKVDDVKDDTKSGDDDGKPGDVADTKTLLSDDEGDGTGVPDKYEFVTTEEIGAIEMTPEAETQFKHYQDRAKEVGLTQNQYQKLVEGEILRGRAAIDEMAVKYRERVDTWAEQTRNDKELGGEDLAKNLAVAKFGMEKFGTPELKKLFDAPGPNNPEGLGLGNHPEVLRFLHRAGVMAQESGDLIDGDGGKIESDASLRRMYPSMFPPVAA